MTLNFFKIVKNFLWICLFILIYLEFCSCKSFNKIVHKSYKDSTATTATHSVSTIDTHTSTETTSTKTITETIDTTVAVKSMTNNVSINIKHIPRDTSYNDGPIKITEKFDPNTSILVIHSEYTPPPLTVYLNKHTEEKTASKSKGDSEIKSAASTKTNTETKELKKDKDVKIESGWNLFWWGLGCGIILMLLIKNAFTYLKSYFKWIPNIKG